MPEDLFWPMTLENATERQILIALYKKTERLEVLVTELSQAVEQLKSSVADLADTVNYQIEPLQEALAAAQQALDDFTVADLAEDADFQAEIDRLKSDVQSKVDRGPGRGRPDPVLGPADPAGPRPDRRSRHGRRRGGASRRR